MVQGCSSNAGKSYLTAGLCRLYAKRGLKVAPFKAQNMSNNAGVTPVGLEMGRAQLLQAQAAGVVPDVRMNPVLIKPEGDTQSQVVVLGKADLSVSKLPWTERKPHLWERVRSSLHSLMDEYDLVILEGAGSPAEVNLKRSDIVNMRVAKEVGARVLLAADIDRGGAFAHLLGTWHCLDEEERGLLSGFILNKFRGDAALLGGAADWLEAKTSVPTLGVVPHLKLPLPEEDAFSLEPPTPKESRTVVAILRTPAMSNFDEFDALIHEPEVEVRWAEHPDALDGASALILPGSKHVAADLSWLERMGLGSAIGSAAEQGVIIWGVCGGLQMLGRVLRDPHSVESGGVARGLSLLDVETELARDKVTKQVNVNVRSWNVAAAGYEIHHGATRAEKPTRPFLDGGLGYVRDNVYGVYVHGLFDHAPFRQRFLALVGTESSGLEWSAQVDTALDTLAAHLETHLDMQAIDRACFGGNVI